MIKEFGIYFLAAFFEILGCYSFWLYFKLDKSYYFLGLGFVSLVAFAYLLTKVNLEFAGRAYAVYGGVYIISSLFCSKNHAIRPKELTVRHCKGKRKLLNNFKYSSICWRKTTTTKTLADPSLKNSRI